MLSLICFRLMEKLAVMGITRKNRGSGRKSERVGNSHARNPLLPPLPFFDGKKRSNSRKKFIWALRGLVAVTAPSSLLLRKGRGGLLLISPLFSPFSFLGITFPEFLRENVQYAARAENFPPLSFGVGGGVCGGPPHRT